MDVRSNLGSLKVNARPCKSVQIHAKFTTCSIAFWDNFGGRVRVFLFLEGKMRSLWKLMSAITTGLMTWKPSDYI